MSRKQRRYELRQQGLRPKNKLNPPPKAVGYVNGDKRKGKLP